MSAKRTKTRKFKKDPRSLEGGGIYKSKIRIIGIGGGGSSIVNEIARGLKRASFVVANTDIQALKQASDSVRRFAFGQDLTRGLGCGMDANLGRLCAEREREKIDKLFEGIDLCILIASLGGGTGSGAAPVFAEILKKGNRNVLGVFTLPFKFEGEKKMRIARASLDKAAPYLNTLTVFPNERIFQVIDRKTPLSQAFSAMNRNLAESLEGLIEMIYLPGLINIDFADLKMILGGEKQVAFLNSVKTNGPNRAEEAVKKVLSSPFGEHTIAEAGGGVNLPAIRLTPDKILFNIVASPGLKMKEVEQISRTISNYNPQARIIFGVACNKSYNDNLRITLLATGSRDKPKKQKRVKPAPPKPSEPTPSAQGGGKRAKPKKGTRKGKALLAKVLSRARKKPKGKKTPPSVKVGVEAKDAKPVNQLPLKQLQPAKEGPSNGPKKEAEGGSDPSSSVQTLPTSRQASFLQKAKTKIRKNALDLKKEIEEAEKEIWAQEKTWDIPAFLRRNRIDN